MRTIFLLVSILFNSFTFCQTDYASQKKLRGGMTLAKKTNGKFVILDQNGVQLSREYKGITEFENGFMKAETEWPKYILLDKRGNAISAEYKSMAGKFSDNRLVVGIENQEPKKDALKYCYVKYGYIDSTGKVALPVNYYSASDFYNGLAQVHTECKLATGKNGTRVISISGKTMYEVFYSGELAGVRNTAGKVIVQPVYQDVGFEQGVFILYTKSYSGIAALNGEVVIKPDTYWNLYVYKPGYYYAVSRIPGGDIGQRNKTLLNSKGVPILPLRDYSSIVLQDKYIIAGFNNKMGVYDINGKVVFDFIYPNVNYVSEDLFGVQQNADNKKTWGIINKSGTVLTGKNYYDVIHPFNRGMAVVFSNGKIGAVNTQGKIIIPVKYDGAFYPEDGMIKVQLNKKFGYVANGKEVIPVIYDNAGDFSNGQATVTLNGETFKIGKDGKRIVPDITSEWSEKIKKDPKDFDAYLQRGIIYFQQDKFPQAISDFSKSIALEPGYLYGNASYYRAYTYFNQKKYKEALTDINRNIKLSEYARSLPDGLNLRAQIYCKMGNRSAAKADEKKIVDLGEAVAVPCK